MVFLDDMLNMGLENINLVLPIILVVLPLLLVYNIIMLELLFGNQNVERIFFTLLINNKCYGKDLAKRFNLSVFGFQTTLKKLEKAGIIISIKTGNIRFFQFNPQYPFLSELKAFLNKAYQFLPQNLKQKYYEPIIRTRPRRSGKSL